jgi:hypothetical protein
MSAGLTAFADGDALFSAITVPESVEAGNDYTLRRLNKKTEPGNARECPGMPGNARECPGMIDRLIDTNRATPCRLERLHDTLRRLLA